MKKESTKHTPWTLFCVNSWKWGMSWSVVDIHIDTSLDKTDFPFGSGYQLQIVSLFCTRPCVQFPISVASPSGLNLFRAYTCCHGLCGFICISLIVSGKPVSVGSSITFDSYRLSTSSSTEFPEP